MQPAHTLPTPMPRESLFARWRTSLRREHGFEPLRVEGTLPDDLSGTLFRNGPGLGDAFGQPLHHLFEGDGAIAAVRLSGGQALGAHKVVQSRELQQERAAGRPLHGFAAPWPTRFLNAQRNGGPKNVANTNVISWQGRLLALMEASPPTELDPRDLSTLGETDLGLIPGAFSAHPHRVSARKALYNFGLRYGRETVIDLFELPDHGAPRKLGEVPLGYPTLLHDFIATDTHFVFFVSPIRVAVWRGLLHVGPFEKLFPWKPELGTEVIIVPIDRPTEVKRFHTDAFFQWHFANAFERGDTIVVDLVRYEDFDSINGLASNHAFEPGRFVRAVVHPQREQVVFEQLWDAPCEFPRIHPDLEGAEHRYTWLASLEEPQLGRVGPDGVQSCTLGINERPSEPLFVPRPDARDEADGWVLSLIYDADRHQSYLGVFDGHRLPEGPVARVWFDHHVPVTFHGNWVPA